MTDMELESKVNVPLLRKAVEWVEEQDRLPREESKWEQAWWVTPESYRVDQEELPIGCGTAYCVAGWLAAQERPELLHTSYAVLEDGTALHSSTVARTLLGISDDEADVLFASTNSASDVRKAAEWIAGERL